MADPAENRLALLFESVVDLRAADRAAFLDAACGADAVLRAKLQRLVDAHEASGDFLPLNPKSTRISPEPRPNALNTGNLVGTNIGPYRLLEQIGEGGWGMVFVAEQRAPVRRRVALKLIKPGMDSKALIARFESERQAVALMEHPNIAKFLDAGTTPLGYPYFVMELVRGTRITDFCDQTRSSTRERLELFVDVCRAVQHAHQKGVIHRDIKPSNILVTSQDGKPVPKIIDFGIAKATQGILTEGTVYTQFHQFIGTPAYMSPEQAEMTSLDIDTRTDIYSLGVLLYELLTGQPPFDPKELVAAGLDAMRRTIREKNPPRPSTRLNTLLHAELTLLAHRRNAEPPRLVHLVRGDLDWIAMRCLEKERSRRYETANDLAADIRRHLDNQPVLARPPSVAYWMQKAWRRHKSTLATVVLFALTLLAAAAISVRSALRANRLAKTEAIQRQRVEQALIWMEVEKSDALFAADDSSAALAYLVRASRRDPFNEAAAARVLSALTQRSFNPSLTEPLRHQAEVVYAQFSPDGGKVVTASWDKTARIWDANTGRPLAKPLVHQARVWFAQFSSDGRRILTASLDKTARIWDATTGQPLTGPLQHDDSVRFAQFSPDGQQVVTASLDRTARIWDANTGRPLTKPLKHQDAVRYAKFSPDGRRVVTGSWDHTARVWDAVTGQPLTEPLRHGAQIWSAEFSPDGRRLVTASWDHTARIWDAETGRPMAEAMKHEAQLLSAQFSPDGQRVVTTSYDRTARIWDSQTGKPLIEPIKHRGGVISAEFSPDGQRLVTTSLDNTARIWAVQTGQPLSEPLHHEAQVRTAQFSSDGLRLVTASDDGTARIWGVPTGQPLNEVLKHAALVKTSRFSPDGRWVVTASEDWTARVWDARTDQPVSEPLIHESSVNAAQFSPNGQWVVTASKDFAARIWEVQTGQLLTKPLKHKAQVNTAEFSPDGQKVITASDDGTALVWDARTGQLLTEPMKHEAEVAFAEFSPDGRRVVTSSWDKTARVWDAQTGKPLAGPMKHEGQVLTARFSPDGLRVATASLDNTARIWDSRTGQSLTEPFRHRGPVVSCQFSSDGKWVVTASEDRTARVWDSHTGQPLTESLKHEAQVTSAQFSPDGRRVVTGSEDATAQVWDVRKGQALMEPLKHPKSVKFAQFSPDGERVVTASEDGSARVWEVPTIPLPVPKWVPQLAEAIADQRFDERGLPHAVSFAEFQSLKESLSKSSAVDVWTRWAKWLFANPAARTLSPLATTTLPEYVNRRIQENTLDSLQEAVRLAPENGLGWARLGRAVFNQPEGENPRQAGEVAWYSLQAIRFAPDEAETWELRGDIFARSGRESEALEAYDRGITTVLAKRSASLSDRRQALAKSVGLLRKRGRLTTAAVEIRSALGIPERDSKAGPDLIDLSPFYNAPLSGNWDSTFPSNDLSELPTGIQTMSGVRFDVRGLVQLAGGRLKPGSFPDRIGGIPVRAKPTRMRFLQGVTCAQARFLGQPFGKYVFHYADGTALERPLVLGRDALDWWDAPPPSTEEGLVVAWSGGNPARSPSGGTVQLYLVTWNNPRPDAWIESVDFISIGEVGGPFLVAATVE